MEKQLAACQRVIGYHFANPSLLEVALTHSSLRTPDRECNERLEFLGDSVLGLVITEELYKLLPDQAEGELTRIKSAVVSRGALYRTSTRLGLARFADFARGVGRKNELPVSVIANLVESIIGAIYLDAGFYPAREFILQHVGAELDDVLNDRGAKNYKSLLQHEVQESAGQAPTYRLVEEEGPHHRKQFTVAAQIRGTEWGRGSGVTKKEAEQEAAKKALEAWQRRGRGRRRKRRRGGSDRTNGEASDRAALEAAPEREAGSRRSFEDAEARGERGRRRRRRRGGASEAPGGRAPRDEVLAGALDEGTLVREPEPASGGSPTNGQDPAEADETPRARPRRSRRRRDAAEVAPAEAPPADRDAPAADAPAPDAGTEERSRRRRARSRGGADEAAPDEAASVAEAPRARRARRAAPPPPPAVDLHEERPTPAPARAAAAAPPAAADDGFAAGLDVPPPAAPPRRNERRPARDEDAAVLEAPGRAKAPAPAPTPEDEDAADGFAAGL